jgi:hypothetical protein
MAAKGIGLSRLGSGDLKPDAPLTAKNRGSLAHRSNDPLSCFGVGVEASGWLTLEAVLRSLEIVAAPFAQGRLGGKGVWEFVLRERDYVVIVRHIGNTKVN